MKRFIITLGILLSLFSGSNGQSNINLIFDSAFNTANIASVKISNGFLVASNRTLSTHEFIEFGCLTLINKQAKILKQAFFPYAFSKYGCISKGSNGGYVVCGNYPNSDSAYLIQLNDSLVEIDHLVVYPKYYSKGLSLFQVIALRNGGYAVIGAFDNQDYSTSELEPDSLSLICLDNKLDVQWERQFGFDKRAINAAKLLETIDGGYAITVNIKLQFISFGTPYLDQRCQLLKTDLHGSLQWMHVTGGPDKQNGTISMAEANDHAILLGACFTNYVDWEYTEFNQVTVQKFSLEGDSVWTTQFGHPTGLTNYLGDIKCDNTGNIYCCGADLRDGEDAWILKLNSLGDSLWFKHYKCVDPYIRSKANNHVFNNIHLVNDNEIFALGFVRDYMLCYNWIISIDQMGNPNLSWVGSNERDKHLAVYPNPANNSFRVAGLNSIIPDQDNNGIGNQNHLLILDTFGEILQDIEVLYGQDEIVVDCSRISPGTYPCLLMQGRTVIATAKVVRQ